MTDDDMFDHMDTILGENVGAKERKAELTAEPLDRRNPEVNDLGQPDSKPSAIWNLVDKFGMTIEISAKDLKLWGVADE